MSTPKIDFHSHIFNAEFLPIGGAIKVILLDRSFGTIRMPDYVIKCLESLIRNVMQRGSKSLSMKLSLENLEKDDEDSSVALKNIINKYLSDLSSGVKTNYPESSDEQLMLAFNETKLYKPDLTLKERRKLVRFIKKNKNKVDLDGIISEPLVENYFLKSGVSPGNKKEILNKLYKTILDDSIGNLAFVIAISIIGVIVFGILGKIPPLIDWVKTLLMPRVDIIKKLQDKFPAEYYIHHDMDMADWYAMYGFDQEKITDYHVEGDETCQVEIIKSLCNNHPLLKDYKPLKAFYAYNPMKGIDLLKRTVNKSGPYIGVKFYPPSGYRAIGNSFKQFKTWGTKLRQWDVIGYYKRRINEINSWDSKNIELFRYCVENEIPLMTHCNKKGMVAYRGAGKNSNPDIWREVLEKDEFKKLRLCFGHAGGHDEWVSGRFTLPWKNFRGSYAEKVYKLCTEYENVYCDFSINDELQPGKKRRYFVKRLNNLIRKSENKPFNFGNKIIFGTDYHLLLQEKHAFTFSNDYEDIFSKEEYGLTEFQEKFFVKNAERYLDNQLLTD